VGIRNLSGDTHSALHRSYWSAMLQS
jgi:hypothetical protein